MHYYAANAMRDVGQKKEARENYLIAIKLDPSHAAAHSGLPALAGTTPRAMSQALSKLLTQFVPVQTTEQLAALPRPEEPTALADALDINDASLDEPATPEPANWSMFNESFEKPLTSEEDLPPGAATTTLTT